MIDDLSNENLSRDKKYYEEIVMTRETIFKELYFVNLLITRTQ